VRERPLAERPPALALRVLGRETMDLVQACFDANTSLPRAFQEMLNGEEIAAIRVWQAWALERVDSRVPVPLIDADLPRPPD
jgi:hypothetical protein